MLSRWSLRPHHLQSKHVEERDHQIVCIHAVLLTVVHVARGVGLAGPVSADYGLETLVSNLTRALSQGRSTFMRLQASGVAGGAAFSREASSDV